MSMKNKPIINEKSSQKVAKFLESNNIHKKDFAQMIGVTLSYVYNLIDETIPFSSRATTLERIATVMDIRPEEFIEYQIPQDPPAYNENLEFLKDAIKHNNLSTVEFLKMFERKKRLNLVDILRGAKPIQIDFCELKNISDALNLSDEELYELWQRRMTEFLKEGGFNIEKNKKLLDSMFEGAKKYLKNPGQM